MALVFVLVSKKKLEPKSENVACSPEEAGLEGKAAAMSIDWRSVRVVAEGTRLI